MGVENKQSPADEAIKKAVPYDIATKLGYNWKEDKQDLAKKAGIEDYTGTAEQNFKIKEMLVKDNKEKLDKEMIKINKQSEKIAKIHHKEETSRNTEELPNLFSAYEEEEKKSDIVLKMESQLEESDLSDGQKGFIHKYYINNNLSGLRNFMDSFGDYDSIETGKYLSAIIYGTKEFSKVSDDPDFDTISDKDIWEVHKYAKEYLDNLEDPNLNNKIIEIVNKYKKQFGINIDIKFYEGSNIYLSSYGNTTKIDFKSGYIYQGYHRFIINDNIEEGIRLANLTNRMLDLTKNKRDRFDTFKINFQSWMAKAKYPSIEFGRGGGLYGFGQGTTEMISSDNLKKYANTNFSNTENIQSYVKFLNEKRNASLS